MKVLKFIAAEVIKNLPFLYFFLFITGSTTMQILKQNEISGLRTTITVSNS
ncbi:hypothetical protein CSE_02210 [Caldisericum exile AZM16c01]|uniref:Uncharacterized protein n=1 Tax=Caldisericum exile (strain DSM 21853 / NBRC 104410 / AZM16c01) TaxID=511051 RepID=A0A7U6JGK1_CALEA|nr:hypothetical protein CSE_02210 [Caldisericum exile AZM16c01]